MIARFAPFHCFNRSYFFRSPKSFWIKIRLDSTKHVRTLLIPHRVIRLSLTY